MPLFAGDIFKLDLPGFPLHEPVFVFAILILTILLAPFIFRLIKIPDIAAYLIAGIIIGPHALHLLDRDASVELFGTVGLLYIMFVAGIDLNLTDFKKNRGINILFGIFTFLLPLLTGYVICKYILNLNELAVWLISIMFSTHTLVAYPVVRKLGITSDKSVLAAVGGTIITDTMVLLVLSLITGLSSGNSISSEIVRLVGFFSIYLVGILYLLPRLAAWFFKNVKTDRTVHYVFLLGLMFVSATLAKFIGVEPIIGAFIAGLALNRVIPKNSTLLQYVDFVGNALFIPFFLIGIGMLIDLSILFEQIDIWKISVLLFVSALFGKWLAAYLTQKLIGFSSAQRNVLFGLTSSHAAATIAVIVIGYERNMIDDLIFNSVIVIILVTCLTAMLVTEVAGKKLAKERVTVRDTKQKSLRRILVPVANPSTMTELISLAVQMNPNEIEEPVYAVTVVKDDVEAGYNLESIRKRLESNLAAYNILAEKIKIITRIDLSITNGILLAAKELAITDIVIGWGRKSAGIQKMFGNIFDFLLNSNITMYSCQMANMVQDITAINVFAGKYTEVEPAFASCMNNIRRIPSKKDTRIMLLSNSETTIANIRLFFAEKKFKNLDSKLIHNIAELESEIDIDEAGTLNVLFIGRRQYISFDPVLDKKIRILPFQHSNGNMIIIVPGFE